MPTVATAKKPPLCTDGRYLLPAGALGTGGPQAFVISGRRISIDGCGRGNGKTERTKKGTKISTRWKRCNDLRKLELRGTVSPVCGPFAGTVRAKGKGKQATNAQRSTGCGDGLVDPGLGETCDVSAACGPSEVCSAVCRCEPAPTTTTTSSSTTTTTSVATTTTTVPPNCGNGTVEIGETCDDANQTPCDGCTACQIDTCGNGVLCTDLGEQCEDANTTSGDGCSSACEIESSSCTNPPVGTRIVTVSLTVPPATPLAGVQVTLDYPQFQTSIPGTGTSSLVQDRTEVFAQPTAGTLTAITYDSDQDVSTVVYAPGPPGTEFIRSGPFVRYAFDDCTPIDQGVCNRAQTVVGCCNDTADPNQFNNPNFCNGTTPQIACASGFDTECPPRANASCTGAAMPYACCTGAGTGSCDSLSCTASGVPSACCTGLGTGNCEAVQLGCTANSQPFPCCTGSGTGNCPVPTKGSCNVKCPANPPICAVNFAVTPEILNFSTTTVGPCQGKVCSNNGGRACMADADCVAPGTCTGTQQSGACPGDNECKPQQSLTGCSVRDPVNALGQAVDGVSCTVTVQG